MFLFRVLSSLIILLSIPSCVFANHEHETINSVRSIKYRVHRLHKEGVPFEDIVVVWDFHGVLTPQKRAEGEMTLNTDVTDVLKYLHKRKVSQLVATAWLKPSQVGNDLCDLGLNKYFDNKKTKNNRISLEEIDLGKKPQVPLEGYKNGRLVALRKQEQESSNPFFPKKAFGVEWCYPEKDFKYIIFIDDSKDNLTIFKRDFKETTHYKKKAKLNLYHLDPSYQKAKTARKTHSRQASGEYNVFLSESE